MNCIICNKKIEDNDLIFYIGLDRPYVNIKVHRSCFKNTNINRLFTEHPEIVYNYIEMRNNNNKTENNTEKHAKSPKSSSIKKSTKKIKAVRKPF